MFNSYAGFVRAIIAQPLDNNVKLVYSDFIEENGDAEWANFIRLSIEQAQFSLFDREKHAALAYLRFKVGMKWPADITIKSGFIVKHIVDISKHGAFEQAVELARRHPIRQFSVTGYYRPRRTGDARFYSDGVYQYVPYIYRHTVVDRMIDLGIMSPNIPEFNQEIVNLVNKQFYHLVWEKVHGSPKSVPVSA